MALLPEQVNSLREKLGVAIEKSPNLSGRLYRSLYEGVDRNPDKWAKVRDLSDQTGIPADTVDRNMPRVRKDAALTDADIDKTVRESPKTTEFLTEDDNAGLVDAEEIRNMRYQESIITGSMFPATPQDVTNIIDDPIVAPLINVWGALDPLFDRLGVLGEVQRNLFSAVVGGLGTAVAGVTTGVEALGRIIEPGDEPFDPRQSVGRDISRKVSLLQEAITGENPRLDPQSGLEVTTAIAGNVVGQFLPFLIPGIGPAVGGAALVGQGVSEATRRQARSGELGRSTQTDLGLLAAGAASGAINFLPFDFILRKPLARVGSGVLRRGAQTTLAYGLEGGSELADAHSQAIMERFFTANKDAIATENPWRLFFIGGFAGAAIDLSFQAATRGVHGAHKDQLDAMRALSEGASLDILAKGSQDSKLRKTREKSYRSFLQKTVNPETKVYLDGPEMSAFLEEKGHAAVQQDAGLSLIAEALRKRETATQDAEVSLTDYLTVIAPSNSYKDIRSHVRTDPTGISIATVREREAANIAYVDELADLAEQDESAAETLAQVRQVEDMLFNQLAATGALDTQIARSTAKVSAARFARGAAERSISPLDFFRQTGLRTEGAAATRRPSTTVSIALGEGQSADEAVRPLLDDGVRVLSQRTVDDGVEVEVAEPLTDEQAALPGVTAQVATPEAKADVTLEQANALDNPYAPVRSGNIAVATREQPLRGATLYEPATALTGADTPAPPVVEMPATGTGVQTFRNAVLEARRGDPTVTVLPKDDYVGTRLFLSQDGTSGAGVAATGEIVSVFGDARAAIVLVALNNGGSWLTTFDAGVYPDIGLTTVARTPWNPAAKPKGWKVTELGKPDTLYMAKGVVARSRRVAGREEAVARVNDALSGNLRQDARGDFNPDTNVIRLFEGADASTWLHEFGHFMKTVEDASDSPISQDIKAWHSRNAAAVAEEAGVTVEDVRDYLADEDPVYNIDIERALQEQFARAWETYLSEGTAPSAGLRDAFRVFSARFREVYPDIPGQLRVNMDDEIRGVFQRLIASAEQIEDVARSDQYRPLFTDATMAGMTEAQFVKYQERQAKVKDEAAESLQAKLFKRLKRRESKKWKDETQSIIDELLPEIENNRVNTARRRLADDLGVDRTEAKRLVGIQRPDTVTAQPDVRLPVQLNGLTKTGGEGIPAGQAAAVFGYESGAEMLQDIVNSPTAKQTAERRAEEIMKQRHGSLDERVDVLVAAAMQNESHAKVLLAELEALGRKRGESEQAQIRQLAKDRVARKSYRQLTPALYRNAEIRAAKEAQRALDRGDRDGAAAAKQAQLVNHYLAVEAQAARDRIERGVDRLGRYRKESTQKAIRASNGGHWEQIQAILARFEFRKSATLAGVEQANLAEWGERRINEFGEPLEIEPELLSPGFVTHWKDVPLRTLEGVLGTVRNIEHVARRSAEVIVNDERKNLDAQMAEGAERLGKLPEKWRSKRTDSAEGSPSTGHWVADMTKIQWLVRWMDGGEGAGFWHSILVTPLNRAFKMREDMFKESLTPVVSLFDNFSDETKRRMAQTFYIETLPGDKNITGEQALMVALNAGNKTNLAKLIVGEGWGSRDDPDSLTIENPHVQAVLALVNEEQWRAAETIWAKMDELYPQLQAVYERSSGKKLGKVEPQEIVTPFGTVSGGYFPLVKDFDRSPETPSDQTENEDGLFGPNIIRQAGVTTSSVFDRTQADYTLSLNLDVVVTHFTDTIHYIAYHDAVRSINRVIKHPLFRTAVKRAFGPGELSQFAPWLEGTAKQGRMSSERRAWSPALRHLRMGMTYGVLGFKYSTLTAQTLGLSSAAAEVGKGNMIKGLAHVAKDWAHLESGMAFAAANSDVLANRVNTFDREVIDARKRLRIPPGLRGKALRGFRATQLTSLKLIGLIQLYMVDLPTWYGAYFKEISISGNEQKAFRYADSVVEDVHGSGRVENMAALMRDQREEVRMMTTFMTFFSARWNAQRDLFEGFKAGRYGVTDIASRAMFMLIVPTLASLYLHGDLLPDEDEDPEDNFWQVLTRVALEPAASVPLLRTLASSAAGFEYSLSPLAGVFEDMLGGIGAVKDEITDPDAEFTSGDAKDLFYTTGVLLHIPGTHQAWGTAEHIWRVIEEGEELTFHELAFGPENE